MEARIDYANVAPPAIAGLVQMEAYLGKCGLEAGLLDLVKLRASYLNGCAYCVDMHTKDARARGETEQRLYAVPVWEETPFFSPRERAALAWAETVTQIGVAHAPDQAYQEARAQFSEQELVDLTVALIAINGWNRLAISFRKIPGTYQPSQAHLKQAR